MKKKCDYKSHKNRLLTYNPTLATKKRYEISRMDEKAKSLTVSQAIRTDYGEIEKYVNFIDKVGNRQKQ